MQNPTSKYPMPNLAILLQFIYLPFTLLISIVLLLFIHILISFEFYRILELPIKIYLFDKF